MIESISSNLTKLLGQFPTLSAVQHFGAFNHMITAFALQPKKNIKLFTKREYSKHIRKTEEEHQENLIEHAHCFYESHDASTVKGNRRNGLHFFSRVY